MTLTNRLFRNFEAACSNMDDYFKDILDPGKDAARIEELSRSSFKLSCWAAVFSVTVTLSASVLTAGTMYLMFTTFTDKITNPDPVLVFWPLRSLIQN